MALAAMVMAEDGAATDADFQRAASVGQRFANRVFRASVVPHWFKGNERFWYRVQTGKEDFEYIMVNAKTGNRQLAFDHEKLGAALKENPKELDLWIADADARSVTIITEGKRYRADRRTYQLELMGEASEESASDSLPAFLPPRPSGGGQETSIRFENESNVPITANWVNQEGVLVKYHLLKPGESRIQRTFSEHTWAFTDADGKVLACYQATDGPGSAIYRGKSPVPTPAPLPGVTSPDGTRRATVRDFNVYVDGKPVTQSGTAQNEFEEWTLRWSPRGTYLAGLQTEAGGDRKLTFIESSPADQVQPKIISVPYLKPGDKIPRNRLRIINPATGAVVLADETLTPNPWDLGDFGWSADEKELYFTYNQRGHQVMRLLAMDAATGKVRQILEETSPTFIDYSSKRFVRYLPSGEAVWMSERSGYNHLYLVNLKTGALRSITKGDWVVRAVESVDEKHRTAIIRVMGKYLDQSPYHQHYARVALDSGKLVMLTDGDGTHRISFSPDGKTFLDTYSRVDMPPVNELRRTGDGKLVSLLERGESVQLVEQGWTTPERFVSKGRDGKTDIWGVIWRPTNFDPAKKYPVIEQIYAGPHDHHVPVSFSAVHSARSMAELGFIVVSIDGMGTNWRSRAFHDVAWKNLADSGFPDRILWMQAAAKDRSYMDLTRVGVYGTSAGGQNAASAVMRFGDFYRAAVADCGCHDNRMDKVWWNEQWMGWPVDESYAANSNVTAAKNLKGALFLMVGEMDTNVDPASTAQVANALLKAGKKFDYLVVPGAGHGVFGQPIPFRMAQEFFLRELGRPR